MRFDWPFPLWPALCDWLCTIACAAWECDCTSDGDD